MTTTDLPGEPTNRASNATLSAAAVIVLFFLLLSLIIIYLVAPLSTAVGIIGVLLLAGSLALALYGGWRGVAIVASITAIASIVAVAFMGQAWFGNVGATLLALLWGMVLFFIFRWGSRNVLFVPKDRALLIVNTYTGTVEQAVPPISPPLVPFIQRRIAEIPLYELDDEVKVEKINTNSGGDNIIDSVKIHVRYKVVKSPKVLGGIPSRSQAQSAVAKEMGKSVTEARVDVAFWEKLLSRQMHIEVEDIVRMVLRGATNVVEAYNRSTEYAEEIRFALDDRIKRWGVETTLLDIEHIEAKADNWKNLNKEQAIEKETKQKELEAKRDADRIEKIGRAMAQSEAERVGAVLRAVREAGVDLPQDVVIGVIRGASEPIFEGEYVAVTPPPADAAKPAEKKDEKK